jgi:D-lactate dehydrogenase (quinone)
MSALPPKADVAGRQWNVRFVPKADIPCAIISVGLASSRGAVAMVSCQYVAAPAFGTGRADAGRCILGSRRCRALGNCMSNAQLISDLEKIVGARHVLTTPSATRRFRKGFRFGDGPALAVICPGSLVEMWRSLRACSEAGNVVLMQAANTGLTGGSTPDGDTYDREIVIISTLRLAKIHLIRGGKQVICLPGATLFQLEDALDPIRRNPHSVIGSSCIGASVFGGVCNNSGGALIHRGPAFTQMTLYAQIDDVGQVHLVNHLGIKAWQ